MNTLGQALPLLIDLLTRDPWWWQPLPAGAQIDDDELVDRLRTALPAAYPAV